MPVVDYMTFGDEIVYENRNGVERDYMRDPLGNTVALLDNTQTQTDTFTYWPYGEVITRTGTTATPFQFCGALGYYFDAATNLAYVRARFLSLLLARWTSVDPAWPRTSPYAYAAGSPARTTDPSGLRPPPTPDRDPVVFAHPGNDDPPCASNPSQPPCPTNSPGSQPTPQPKPCLYGNYCGPCDGHGLNDHPIDDLDRCCCEHDRCAATLCDWLPWHYEACQCSLAHCALGAYCFTTECLMKKTLILAYAGIGCLGVGGPGVYL